MPKYVNCPTRAKLGYQPLYNFKYFQHDYNYNLDEVKEYFILDTIEEFKSQFRQTGLYYLNTKEESIKWEFICRQNLNIDNLIYSTTSETYNFEVSATIYKKDSKLYDVEGKKIEDIKFKEQIKTAIIKTKDVTTKTRIINVLNDSLNINANDNNYKYFIWLFSQIREQNIDRLKPKPAIPHLGWFKDEFVNYSNDVTFDFTDDTEKSFKTLVDNIKPNGTIEDWEKIIKKYLLNSDFNFIMGTFSVCPLLKKIGLRSYQLMLNGESESGKTFACCCGLSLWGKPSFLMLGANDTSNSFEEKTYLYQNIPVLVDETTNLNDKDLYKLPNETSRGRLNKESKLKKQRKWRTIGVFTGESSILSDNSRLGEYNRTIDYKIDNKMYLDKGQVKKDYSLIDKNYSYAGKKLIEEYNNLSDEFLLNKITEIYDYIKIDSKLDNNIHCIAISCLGTFLFRKILFGINDWNYCLELGQNIVKKLEDKQNLRQEQKALESVYSWIDLHKNNFSENCINERYGIEKDGKIFINGYKIQEFFKLNNFNFKIFKDYIKNNQLGEYKQTRIPGTTNNKPYCLILPIEKTSEELTPNEERIKTLPERLYFATIGNSKPVLQNRIIQYENPDFIKTLDFKNTYYIIKNGNLEIYNLSRLRKHFESKVINFDKKINSLEKEL